MLRAILIALAVTVPVALLTAYRVDGPMSTAATLWLIGGFVAAILAAILAVRLVHRLPQSRVQAVPTVAVLTLGIYQFATKGFRLDTFDFWFAVVTVSVVLIATIARWPRQA